MEPEVSYINIHSTRPSRGFYSFRSDAEVDRILAEVRLQLHQQPDDASHIDSERSSDTASLRSLEGSAEIQVDSDGSDEHSCDMDYEQISDADNEEVVIEPYVSTGPLCITAKRKRKHSGNDGVRVTHMASNRSSSSGFGEQPDAQNTAELQELPRKKHRRFSTEEDAHIRNSVLNRTGKVGELWELLGKDLGCKPHVVKTRWRSLLKDEQKEPPELAASANAFPTASTATVAPNHALVSQRPQRNITPSYKAKPTITEANYSCALGKATLSLKKRHPTAFQHGSLKPSDLDYLMRCMCMHAQNGCVDKDVELLLQLGVEFGVSVGTFLTMWTTFLKKTCAKFDKYLRAGKQLLRRCNCRVVFSPLPVFYFCDHVFDCWISGGSDLAAGQPDAQTADAQSVRSGEHDSRILQRVAAWNGKGRGLWKHLAAELHSAPQLVMSRWTHLQLHNSTASNFAADAPVAPQATLAPAQASSSSKVTAAGPSTPLTAELIIDPKLGWSEKEVTVAVNALKLLPDLGKGFPMYLAAKLQKPEHDVRASLLRLVASNPGLDCGHKVASWYNSTFGSTPAEDALLVRTVLRYAAENNGIVVWKDVAGSLATSVGAFKPRWDNELSKNALLLYLAVQESGNASASATAAPLTSVLHGVMESMVTAVELKVYTERGGTGARTYLHQVSFSDPVYVQTGQEMRLCKQRLEKRRRNYGWNALPISGAQSTGSSEIMLQQCRKTVYMPAELELSQSEVEIALNRISDANKHNLPLLPLVVELAAQFCRSTIVVRKSLLRLRSTNANLNNVICIPELLGTFVDSKSSNRALISSILQSAGEKQGKVFWYNIEVSHARLHGTALRRWRVLVSNGVFFLYKQLRGISKQRIRAELAAHTVVQDAASTSVTVASAPDLSTPSAAASSSCAADADPAVEGVSRALTDMVGALELSYFRGAVDERLGYPDFNHMEMPTSAATTKAASGPPLMTPTANGAVGSRKQQSEDPVHTRKPYKTKAQKTDAGAAPAAVNSKSVKASVDKPSTIRHSVQGLLDRMIRAIEEPWRGWESSKHRFTAQEDEMIVARVRERTAQYLPIDWASLDTKLSRTPDSTASHWRYVLAVQHPELRSPLTPKPSTKSKAGRSNFCSQESAVADDGLGTHVRGESHIEDDSSITSAQIREQVQDVLDRTSQAIEEGARTRRKSVPFTAQDDAAIIARVAECSAAHRRVKWANLDRQLGRNLGGCKQRWVHSLAASHPLLCTGTILGPYRKSSKAKSPAKFSWQAVETSDPLDAFCGADDDGDGEAASSPDRVRSSIQRLLSHMVEAVEQRAQLTSQRRLFTAQEDQIILARSAERTPQNNLPEVSPLS